MAPRDDDEDGGYRPTAREVARDLYRRWRKVGLRGLMDAGRGMAAAERSQDLDAEAPEIVVLDARAKRLLDRAQDLAADGREDPAAVRGLVRIAGRDQRALRVAALGARQCGQHREGDVANRAHRLLEAALTGQPVTPVSPSEQQRLDMLDDFKALEPEEQWRVLLAREPRLGDLQADVTAGALGKPMHPSDYTALPPDQRSHAARVYLESAECLDAKLRPLVGPDSGSSDPLASSRLARDVAREHLGPRAGGSPANQ